jgi:hypothetical protein
VEKRMKPFDLATTTTLTTAVHAAEAQLSAAKAEVSLADARVHLADVALATIRWLAAEKGIELSTPTMASGSGQNVSEPEFAKLMGVSARTIANDRKHMTEGLHYHHHGRRVLYHMPEAQDFIRQSRGSSSASVDVERLAMDEVNRRRARAAMKRIGGRR